MIGLRIVNTQHHAKSSIYEQISNKFINIFSSLLLNSLNQALNTNWRTVNDKVDITVV